MNPFKEDVILQQDTIIGYAIPPDQVEVPHDGKTREERISNGATIRQIQNDTQQPRTLVNMSN